MLPRFFCCMLLVGATFISTAELAAGDPTTAVRDASLKTLNGHFPFQVPATVEQWNARQEELRRRVLVATGLWPMPARPPIKPVLHGMVIRDGFTVERIYFESLPGHFVTGLLFRPAGEAAQHARPGVLCPHGHGGRLMRLSDADLAKQIESGGEIHSQSGRYPKLARCAHLARMGCVSLIFDMLGYADSQQVEYSVAHRHREARPEESQRDEPCFFSIDADLNLQSIMGLQTWNALRAMDVLASLPDVDADRLGVTGGSGGGTQSILLGAIDPRVKVSFPNGMVSTSMQGGCYCENCNYLRIDTGNVELAALMAPRPQGMTAADDWTKEMMNDGFPELKKLYTMLGQPNNVMCRPLLEFPHNYNYVTRATMYPLMAEHLGLGPTVPLVEEDFEPLSEAEMTVWNDEHPAPQLSGIRHEREVLQWWTAQNQLAMRDSLPGKVATDPTATQPLTRYQEVIGGAWRIIFDRRLPKLSDLSINTPPATTADAEHRDSLARQVIQHEAWKVQVDVAVIPPSSGNHRRTIVFADATPHQRELDSVRGRIAQWLGGDASWFADARLVIPRLDHQQRLVEDQRNYSAFTFGYNRSLAARQCEQLLCVIAAFAPEQTGELVLVATGQGIGGSSAAAVTAGPHLSQFVVATDGFRFANVESFADADFVPGAVKYGDLPGLLALRAPYPIQIIQEPNPADMETVTQAYAVAGAASELVVNE